MPNKETIAMQRKPLRKFKELVIFQEEQQSVRQTINDNKIMT